MNYSSLGFQIIHDTRLTVEFVLEKQHQQQLGVTDVLLVLEYIEFGIWQHYKTIEVALSSVDLPGAIQ